MASSAQLRAQAKYDKDHTKSILLKLNLTYDADILSKLDEMDNKQGYIKRLLRQDIRGPEDVISVDSIRYLIRPVAIKYRIRKAYLFGSYARGSATAASDIDIMIEGGDIGSVGEYEKLKKEMSDSFEKSVDLVMYEAANRNTTRAGKRFMEHFNEECIAIYG